MSKDYRSTNDSQIHGDYGVPRYSRSAGIASYRRRRRLSRAFTCIVGLILIAVIGGAAVMFSRSYLGAGESAGTASSAGADDSSQSAEAVNVTPAQLSVAAVGDVIMNSSVVESGHNDSGSYNFDHLFSNVAGELVGFDLRSISQETAMSGNSFGYGNSWPLNAPQDLGRAEVTAGFNVILRATDHALDTGWNGLHTELSWWDAEYPGTPILGVAEPDPAQHPGLSDYVNNVYTVEKDGFRIAILNHTIGISGDDEQVVSTISDERIAEDVQRARNAGAQMIIACPHWGTEGSTEPTGEEMYYAQVYANHSVDVIIGTNPRVLQRVDVLENHNGNGHKTLCFYSLGCFTSSLSEQSFLGGMAEFTLARDENNECSVVSAVLKPLVTHRASGKEYSTYLLANYTEDLAYSSWDGMLTPEYLDNQCREILGEGYDAAAHELRINLDGTPDVEEASPAESAEEAPAEPEEEAPAEA